MTIQAKDNPVAKSPQPPAIPEQRAPEANPMLVPIEAPRTVIVNPRHWLVTEFATINGETCKVKEYLQYDSMEVGSVLRCPVYRGYVTKLIHHVARDKKSI